MPGPPLSPGDMQARQLVFSASLGGASQTDRQPLLHEPPAPVLCCGAAVGLRAAGPGEQAPRRVPCSIGRRRRACRMGICREAGVSVVDRCCRRERSPESFEQLFPLRYKPDLTCRRSGVACQRRGGGRSPFLGSHRVQPSRPSGLVSSPAFPAEPVPECRPGAGSPWGRHTPFLPCSLVWVGFRHCINFALCIDGGVVLWIKIR